MQTSAINASLNLNRKIKNSNMPAIRRPIYTQLKKQKFKQHQQNASTKPTILGRCAHPCKAGIRLHEQK